VGQCEISHPVSSTPGISVTESETGEINTTSPVDALDGMISPGRNVLFQSEAKGQYEPLDARIVRLYYINAYGSEIHPAPNPDYIRNLSLNDVLVYSCGSLWTSIIPCLALKGVANAIARSRSLRAKVLLLNSRNDRETDGYTGVDYVKTIVRTLNAPHHSESYSGLGRVDTTYPASAFITHLLYLKGTTVEVDVMQIMALGVRCVEVEGSSDEKTGLPQFDAACVRQAMRDIIEADTRE